MMSLTRSECAAWLSARDHFTILTHRKPDGDTIGSAAALCRGLRSLGKTAHVLHNPDITPLFSPLLEGLVKDTPEEGDLLIAVDVAADSMLPKPHEYLKNCIDLRIDHHGLGREYAPTETVDPDAAACAEIIWDILGYMDIAADKETAEAIYVGISTDTGCFRFANTTEHTFDAAADCVAAGADIALWNRLLFDTISLSKLRLQGWVAEHAKIFCDGKFALCALPKQVEQSFGMNEDDMSNVSAFLRSIEGVCMAALLRETDSEYTKVSMRAIPGYNAMTICQAFGGGGHAGAAGCSVRLPLEQAADTIEKAMLDWENS